MSPDSCLPAKPCGRLGCPCSGHCAPPRLLSHEDERKGSERKLRERMGLLRATQRPGNSFLAIETILQAALSAESYRYASREP